jgi:hypothetical protein
MTYTTVADLSVDEFKSVIREVVRQTLAEMLADPDSGLDLREDVKKILRDSVSSYQAGEIETSSAEQVAEKLGLEW